MIGLATMLIRLMIAICVLSLWLCWALIALPMVLIMSATGNPRAAKSLERSLRWHRHFHLF